MNISFFGHRIQDMGGFNGNDLQTSIRTKIQDIFLEYITQKKSVTLLTGLNIGIDQWAAGTALDLKIPYIVYIPFDNMESKWPFSSKKVYTHLLKNAQKKVILDKGAYSLDKIVNRERKIIDESDMIYSFFATRPPFFRYAAEANKIITDILPVGASDDHFISI